MKEVTIDFNTIKDKKSFYEAINNQAGTTQYRITNRDALHDDDFERPICFVVRGYFDGPVAIAWSGDDNAVRDIVHVLMDIAAQEELLSPHADKLTVRFEKAA